MNHGVSALAFDDVVAVQGAQRNGVGLGAVGEGGELGVDVVEDAAVEADQVHLVDGEHEVRDAEQPGDPRMAPRLFADSVARVHEQDGQVRRRGAGRHVARVLLVAGRVGEDELAPRGREVPVGDVDGDALFALGLEAVGEQREIDRPGAAIPRRGLHRRELILVDRARLVEQPADQRALAVVDAACGAEAEKRRHQKYPSRFFISIDAS